jgi:dGTPase
LAEAIALGHDLGHTPFGHAGERALDEILINDGGFKHNEQSLRVVDRLERDGQGLNLTCEVLDGILCHTGETLPCTPEGRVIRIADRIAYINHDVDDAIRAGILMETDIPAEITRAFGSKHGERINALILDMVGESDKSGEIALSPQLADLFDKFHSFMMNTVYRNSRAKSEEGKVLGILSGIFDHYLERPSRLTEDYRVIAEQDGLRRAVGDYVSGMTDKYAIHIYEEVFIPEAWQVR